jgi:hypothetical protein
MTEARGAKQNQQVMWFSLQEASEKNAPGQHLEQQLADFVRPPVLGLWRREFLVLCGVADLPDK